MSSNTLAPPQTEPGGWRFPHIDNRYIPPAFITCILLVGNITFGMLESYQKTLLAIVTAIATEMVLGRIFFKKLAPSGERLYQRHQRWHSGSLACLLALRVVRRDFDHVEVRAAGERPPHLESLQLRHFGAAFSGA